MHPLVILLLITCDASLGYYSGYDSRNLVEREEPETEGEGIIVECPVCPDTGHWMPSNEVCSIVKGNKTYKKCEKGTYINTVCGNHLDCFRGPGEQCTEKRDFDTFGQRCAPGYYCNKHTGECQGWDYLVDSKIQYMLNPTPYSFGGRFKGLGENAFIRN